MSRPMRDSGVKWIGNIPEGWRIVKVKKVFVRKKEKANQENPIILSLARSGIKRRDISNNEGQIAESYFEYNPVKKGDLLLNPMDLISGANCNLSYIDGVISPAYINLGIIGDFSAKYFDYYFKCQYWSKAFFAHGKGVSYENRWTLNNETLMNYKIPLPSAEETIKIATFLDSKTAQIDAIIDNTKQSIIEFKKYKQTLITEIVSKGLNPDIKMKSSGIEWIGNVPEHWNVSRLRYLGTLQNGISKSGDAFGSGFPFLSYGDVYRDIELPKTVNGLIESTESDRLNYSVTCGDILFTRTSETIEEVGFSSTCLETIPNVVFAGFLIRFRPTTDELFPRFSKYYFRSQIHRSFFAKEMNLVIRASLSQQLLKKLPVLLPSIEEQQQIADYLDEKCAHIDSLIADKEKLIREFEDYKKAIIYEYVTGKKEVE